MVADRHPQNKALTYALCNFLVGPQFSNTIRFQCEKTKSVLFKYYD